MNERDAIARLFDGIQEHGESLNELRAYVLALSVLCRHLVTRTEVFPMPTHY